MLAADVADDGLVHGVASNAKRARLDDATEREDGDVGGAPANVENHGASRLIDREAGADGCRDRFLDEEDLAGAR